MASKTNEEFIRGIMRRYLLKELNEDEVMDQINIHMATFLADCIMACNDPIASLKLATVILTRLKEKNNARKP